MVLSLIDNRPRFQFDIFFIPSFLVHKYVLTTELSNDEITSLTFFVERFSDLLKN